MQSQRINYYDVLGVDEKASADDITLAYRTCTARVQAGRTTSEVVAELVRLTEAFNVLVEPRLREEYDRRLQANIEGPSAAKSSRSVRGRVAHKLNDVGDSVAVTLAAVVGWLVCSAVLSVFIGPPAAFTSAALLLGIVFFFRD